MSRTGVLKCVMACIAMSLLIVASAAAQSEEKPVTGAALQQAMYDAIVAIEKAGGMEPIASDKFYWNSAEVEKALEAVPEKDEFLTALRGIVKESQAARLRGKTPAPAARLAGTGTGPFWPNYPDLSTDLDYLLLQPLGLVTNNHTRCGGTAWPYYLAGLAGANISLTAAQLACTVAGCDPTGVFCGSICGATEIVMAGYLVLKAPVDACKSWDGKLDSAENEAAYKNSESILYDLAAHDTKITGYLEAQADAAGDLAGALAGHDLAVKALMNALDAKIVALNAALVTHDADMKLRLAELLSTMVINQMEIIKLLKTPEGKRPGWGKEGY